jgi:F-type H+-transporting ATPase subunit c
MLFLTTLGPSLVIAFVGYGAVKALGRNPSAAPRILLSMIFSFVFAEAIAIIALLVIYNLFR